MHLVLHIVVMSQGHGTTSGTLMVPIPVERTWVCLEMGYTVVSYGYGHCTLYVEFMVNGKKIVD